MRKTATTILLFIIAVSAVVRFRGIQSYFPLLWDEAKYLGEIERIIPHFSVNVGAFAFLKLGHTIVGGSSYPQAVTALFGVLSILGLWLLGRCAFAELNTRHYLGLAMAGQAALMPYLVKYSYHATPTIFAFTFFVFALYCFLKKLRYPPVNDADKRLYFLWTALAAGLLAFVPACSFKFLLPTVMLLVLFEVYLWRINAGTHHQHKYQSLKFMFVSIMVGVIFIIIIPVALAIISGYDGWWQRAIELSKAHELIQTMRPAFHFTYPIHVFHLTGLPFVICACIGLAVIFRGPKENTLPPYVRRSGIMLMISAGAYILFYGAFSHLQASRLYILTLPFLLYLSSTAIIRLPHALSRYGRPAGSVVTVILFVSLGWMVSREMSRQSYNQDTYDTALINLTPGQDIWANATQQLIYGVNHSQIKKSFPFNVSSLFSATEKGADSLDPPIVILQEAGYTVGLVGTLDKYDQLQQIEVIKSELQRLKAATNAASIVAVTPDDFFSSPGCYLENIYSWQSYHDIKSLLPYCRDSIYIYK